MEAVWSVVDSSVNRMCSGSNKCVRGALEGVRVKLNTVQDCHIATKTN